MSASPADQRSSALATANEVRAWRKRLRSEIARHPHVGVIEIQMPHDWASSMRLFNVFAWMRVNEREMRRVCRVCDVDSSTRLSQLTQRQRYALATELARVHEETPEPKCEARLERGKQTSPCGRTAKGERRATNGSVIPVCAIHAHTRFLDVAS